MNEELEKTIQPGRVILRQLEDLGIAAPQSPTKVVSRLFRHAGVYPLPNLIVGQCDQKFEEAANQALKDGKSDKAALRAGKMAYCAAMPKLSGAGNIRDFIACVAYAMSLELIPGNEATRLLYAAQVAHQAFKERSLKRGKLSDKATQDVAATTSESIT